MLIKKFSLKTTLLLSVSLIAFVALAYFLFVPRAVKVQTALASRGPFTEVIQADGILRSKDRYSVPAFADGDITRVSLKVGDSVKKGDLIARLQWDYSMKLTAPISGVISKVYRESAGPIRRGEPIVEIIDPSRLEIMAELLTTDAVRLSEGASVGIKNWSDGAPIRGRVSRVSKAGFTKPSALGVE